jgi:long-chain acyl-CoA synthetase
LPRLEETPLAPLIDFMGRKYSAMPMWRLPPGAWPRACSSRGIRKGDRVGLFLPNVPHYVAAYYGAMMMGAIVVNFSPLYTVEELKYQAEDSGTKLLFTLSVKALLPRALEVMEQSCIEQLVVGSVAGASAHRQVALLPLLQGGRRGRVSGGRPECVPLFRADRQ